MLTLDLTHPRAQELLEQALGVRPERLDLAALAVAALEYPSLDPTPALESLDALARRVTRALEGRDASNPKEQLAALRKVLVEEEGFRPNAADYYAPENSFLNVVLQQKVGIPITLSVLWIEVARRAGIPLYGVSFPGHFLVALNTPEGRLVVDPYGGGAVLSPDDCAALLRRAIPNGLVTAELFDAAPVRTILWRMLTNLKRVYFVRQDHARALKVEDLLLHLAPDHPGELRARAALLSTLGAYRAALKDVERCLELGDAPDQPALEQAARTLRQRLQFLN